MASSSEQKIATIVSDRIGVKKLPALTAEDLKKIQDANVSDLSKMKAELKSKVYYLFAQYHEIDKRLPPSTTSSVLPNTDYKMKIKYGTVEKEFIINSDKNYADLKKKAMRFWEEDIPTSVFKKMDLWLEMNTEETGDDKPDETDKKDDKPKGTKEDDKAKQDDKPKGTKEDDKPKDGGGQQV